MFQRYENESNSQLVWWWNYLSCNCFWCFKDMKMKAIHNYSVLIQLNVLTVSDVSKIWKWKQFTTYPIVKIPAGQLFLMFQRYENESNSQHIIDSRAHFSTVSDVSKIWKWKQFTTWRTIIDKIKNCFWCFKDMKMKAIHNSRLLMLWISLLFLIFQRYKNESNSQQCYPRTYQ